MSERTSREGIRLVLHGRAGDRDDVREAVTALRDSGRRVEVRVTREAGDAARFAREAARAGAATVAAGGGDGTVNEVAAGLVAASRDARDAPALAILPLGTANDLADACRIPADPAAALRLIAERAAVPVDVGTVDGRIFVNLATGGFGTRLTAETPEARKRLLGRAAYLITGLTRFDDLAPSRGHLQGPGFEWKGDFLVLAVGNGRQAGGGHRLCPQALIDDGALDVAILPAPSQGELAETLAALLQEGLDALERSVVRARVPWLRVDAPEDLQVNLDGEPMRGRGLRFEVARHRLRMHLPADCPLLGAG